MTCGKTPSGRRIGRSGLFVEGAWLNIYFDPCEAEERLPKADIICLTADDPGQVSARDVLLLAKPQTVVIGVAPCVSRFRLNQLPILPGQTRQVLGVAIRAERAGAGALKYVLRYPDRPEEIRYPS